VRRFQKTFRQRKREWKNGHCEAATSRTPKTVAGGIRDQAGKDEIMFPDLRENPHGSGFRSFTSPNLPSSNPSCQPIAKIWVRTEPHPSKTALTESRAAASQQKFVTVFPRKGNDYPMHFNAWTLGFIAVLLASFQASALEKIDSPEAFALLPERFQGGVVKLSADNADPLPDTWYFIAHNADKGGAFYSITVSGGEITETKPSLDLRALLRDPVRINLEKMEVGALGAWNAAKEFSQRKGKTLGTVSYALQQDGEGAVPIWSVWCYDSAGSYFAVLKVSASSGEVLSSE